MTERREIIAKRERELHKTKIMKSKSQSEINREASSNEHNRDFDSNCSVRYSASGNMMRWCNVIVFSVVVLINISSISCAASRHSEGEFFLLINSFLRFRSETALNTERKMILIVPNTHIRLRQLLC